MSDDLKKLPLPKAAKAYARRKGLKSMTRQPRDFIGVMATITNQKSKQHGFKNDDQGQPVKHEFNEDVDEVIAHLIEADEDDFKELYTHEKRTFLVRQQKLNDAVTTWSIQVPSPYQDAGYENLVVCPHAEYAPDEMIRAVLDRMNALARGRDFPPGSVFDTPWGRFVITKNGTRPET